MKPDDAAAETLSVGTSYTYARKYEQNVEGKGTSTPERRNVRFHKVRTLRGLMH